MFRGDGEPPARIAYSQDSRFLLIAGMDGEATVWDLAQNTEKPRWRFRAEGDGPGPDADPTFSSAVFAPGKERRLVSGHRDGRLILWDLLDDGTVKPTRVGELEGEVRAVVFAANGSRLIAGGADKVVRVWTLNGALPSRTSQRFDPQHTEQVNALVAWLDGPLVASASDDTTIRLWNSETRAPLATFSAADEGRWVAFTPDGRFDSAPGGETRVSWRRDDAVMPLDQFDEGSRLYGLLSEVRAGRPLPQRPILFSKPPPGLAIETPAAAKGGEIELTVRSSEPGLDALAPLSKRRADQGGGRFRANGGPDGVEGPARLTAGENRFVAMAARREARIGKRPIDGGRGARTTRGGFAAQARPYTRAGNQSVPEERARIRRSRRR